MHTYTAAPPRRGRRRKTRPTTWDRYRRKVVLNYGMGWDSTAIFLRWLLEPSSRNFQLDQLIVLMAQVGEWNARGHCSPASSEGNSEGQDQHHKPGSKHSILVARLSPALGP
jgi:hypothetical protein